MTSSWGIFTCIDCTNAWTEPPPPKVKYEEENFHSGFNYKEIKDLPYQWRKAVLMQANLLERYLSPESKILEIGCGEGWFLRELSRRGFNVFGVEPSKTATEYARRSGLNVVQGTFPEIEVPGPFNAIIMSHVLEHIQDPIDLLRKLNNVAPQGYIFLVQTNWQGLMPRIHKEKWYAWVPQQHHWHFTPKGLKMILKPLNWHVAKVEYSSLSHNNNIISLIGSLIHGLGDQFHLVAHISTNNINKKMFWRRLSR
jgi:2-polyprenyl-3-methyl-5-hydroxy-6-metoxy-1,4-benzoquinol methylase